jgi:hypothetical protein
MLRTGYTATSADADMCECGHAADSHVRDDLRPCEYVGCRCGAEITVTGAAVLRAVLAAEPTLPAYVEHTGGGCATVYVGAPIGDRYLAAIGPGSFDWRDSALSMFSMRDLYIGPDDHGQGPALTVRTLADITAYLTPCGDCGEPVGNHLSADACDAAGIDAGLRDGLGCAVYRGDAIMRVLPR